MAKPRMIRNGLSIGNNPLSYMGVEPSSPPDLAEYRRIPTVNDYEGFHVGDIWMANDPTLAPQYQVYLLLSLDNNIARWGQIYPSGAGAATEFMVNLPFMVGHGATPIGGILNLVGAASGNIVTSTLALDNNVYFDLGNNINIANNLTVGNELNLTAYAQYSALVTWNTGLVDVAPVGAAGTVLMSNGAALPTFNAITIHTPAAGGDATLGATGILNFTSLTLDMTAAGNTVNFEVIGGGAVTDVQPDVGAAVTPVAGLLKVFGAASAGGYINIETQNGGAGTLGIALTDNIDFDNTNAAGTQGCINYAGTVYMNNFGTQNTFLGGDAGDLGLTVGNAINNTGIGFNALTSLTVGAKNAAVGSHSLAGVTTGEENTVVGYHGGLSITTGWWNCLIGSTVADGLLTGSNNIIIGAVSGDSYAGAEDSNIIISNTGVVGESNTIRIGTQGAGAGQQQDTYIAGIYTPNAALNADFKVAMVDVNGKLGGSRGTNGQVLISATGAAPAWAVLTPGAGIAITNAANAITITNTGGGGGGGIATVHTDGADASENMGDTSITIVGDGLITTDGAVDTVTISLTNGANGQVLIGGGAAATWANLTSAGGTVTITNGANTINLEAVGGGGGTTAFLEDDANTAYPLAGVITIAGGDNIHTVGLIANTVTIALDYAILWPVTNATFTEGAISLGGAPFMHAYGTNNTFLGTDAATVGITTANDCVGIGYHALQNVTSGDSNVAVGSQSLAANNTGGQNTAVGYHAGLNISSGNHNTSIGDVALATITTGSYNTTLGYNAGNSLTAADSSNIMIGNYGTAGDNNKIRIGRQGAGNYQQQDTWIAGIYTMGTALGATAKVTLVDSTGKLGGLAGAANTVLVGGAAPSFTGSPTLSGTLTVSNGINITAGGMTITTGDINMVNGNILKNGNRWISTTNVHFNQFTGYQAGSATPGDHNTATGYQSMTNLNGGTFNDAHGWRSLYNLTSGSYNQALGTLAGGMTTGSYNQVIGNQGLQSIHTGSYNIGIGYQVGIANTTSASSSNIYLNSAGADESNTLRIGNATGTGNQEVDASYIQGIYGKATAADGVQVWIDSTGKLGTTGSTRVAAFLATLSSNANNQIGDGVSQWVFGTTSVLDDAVTGFDLNNNFSPGGGTLLTPAYFSAPINGVYNFIVTVTVKDIYNVVPPPPPPAIPVDPIRVVIKTAGGVMLTAYQSINPPLIYAANNDGMQTVQFSVTTKMAATNRAYFDISVYYGNGTNTLGIRGAALTWVSGNLITPY